MSTQHAVEVSRHAVNRGPCLIDDARSAARKFAIHHRRNPGAFAASGLNAISEVECKKSRFDH
jgi:hypothetical protein